MITSLIGGNSVLGMVIGFVVTLVPLIILHEIGHMLMAKYLGVWAREFGIGFPPRITKLFQWQETVFTLNWLPLGGFVRLEGEATFDETRGKRGRPGHRTHRRGSQCPRGSGRSAEAQPLRQPPWQQIMIYLSGPVMNILTAWLVAVLLFMVGIPASAW